MTPTADASLQAPAPGGGGTPCLGFVGVSTASSSIRAVFPEWARELGLAARTLVGHDIALNAPATTYRRVVEEIRDDPDHVGALVTTHKVAVFDAASDLFDELDPAARLFGEVSCLGKHGGRLQGSAKDPLTVRLALEELVPEDHFGAHGGQVLIMGIGGAGLALSHELGRRRDRPPRIVCTDISRERLEHARRLHQRAGLPAELYDYVPTTHGRTADELLADLPPASLVVNATGMGKDRPGSPLGDTAAFPESGVVWDFNYRGSLEFLQQAARQRGDRRLRVEDGWRYFIHGWTQLIAELFAVPMPAEQVEVLAEIATRVRR